MVLKDLLGNLPLGRKFLIFAILGAMLVAAPLAAYLSDSNDAIATARRESQGIAPSKQLLRVVQLLQQHRGLSTNVLGGNTAMEQPLRAKRTEVDGAGEVFSATLKAQIADRAIGESWNASVAEWKSLEQAVAGRTLDVAASYARHTALVAKLLDVLDLIVDHFALSLDPDADGYYLMMASLVHLPQLTEVLGQGRARGSLYVSKQDALGVNERSELTALIGLSRMHHRNMMRALDKAAAAKPSLKDTLPGVIAVSQTLYEQALKLTREQVLEATTISYSSAEYFRVYTEAIDGQFKLSDAAYQALDEVLGSRITRLRLAQFWILTAVLLVALLAAGLGYAVTRSITIPLAQAAGVAEHVASGDLTRRAGSSTKDEIGRLLGALERMRAGLAASVSSIRAAADNVGAASAQIAKGNSDLSTRTEEQAAGLQETASSMEELTTTVKQNADSAKQASLLAKEASAVATQGGAAVRGVVSTMQDIAQSSSRIADIIGVIDSIAFQTNILALNAAVEAARAGEQGRGFAVVAAEVRALAQRSAQASKEINGLIQESVARVDGGARQAEDAGKTMDAIVASANKVNSLIAEIAQASAEQLAGIEQVNRAILQMDSNTQQNAAVVEEAAAAAEHMAAEAQGLVTAVAKFKLERTEETQEAHGAYASAALPSVRKGSMDAPRAPIRIATRDDRDDSKRRALPEHADERRYS